MEIPCPHCNTANQTPGNFCGSCGKALPALERSGPRVLSGQDIAASSPGRSLQLDLLTRQMRSAFRILLALGILQALGAVLLFVGSLAAPDKLGPGLFMVAVILSVISCIFLGLAAWARSSPFPAAITGLVIYCSLTALDFFQTLSSGAAQQGAFGWFIRIAIIAALAKAVSAGVKYRAIKRQLAEEQADRASTNQNAQSEGRAFFRDQRDAA